MAYVPCDDGLVQDLVWQDRSIRLIYDTLKLRHLHRTLSGDRYNRLFPEDQYTDVLIMHIYPPDNCSIYTIAVTIWITQAHSIHKMVCTGWKEIICYMKTEVNPQDTNRAEAFELWMSSPMPMVTLTKTFDVSNLIRMSRSLPSATSWDGSLRRSWFPWLSSYGVRFWLFQEVSPWPVGYDSAPLPIPQHKNMSKFARDIAVKQYLILLLPQEFHNLRGFSNVNPNVGTMWEHFDPTKRKNLNRTHLLRFWEVSSG